MRLLSGLNLGDIAASVRGSDHMPSASKVLCWRSRQPSLDRVSRWQCMSKVGAAKKKGKRYPDDPGKDWIEMGHGVCIICQKK